MRSKVYPVETIMTYQLLLSDLTLLPHPFNGVTGKDFQGNYLFSCDNEFDWQMDKNGFTKAVI